MNDYDRVAAVIRHLDENHAEQPSLGDLASASGLSESHFHRLFHRWAGVTPKDFLQSLTLEHAKRRLRESASVLDAALDAGLSGPGRLHDLLVTIEAASPGEFKSGGEGMSIEWGMAESPFGICSLGWNSRGLCHLVFREEAENFTEPSELRANWPNAELRRNDLEARRRAKIIFYQAAISGEDETGARPPRAQFSAPSRKTPGGRSYPVPSELTMRRMLDARARPAAPEAGALPALKAFVRATPFQLQVWRALLQIPEGCVASYGGIAGAIDNPKATRAVGTACGSNPVAYLIPCHRVIRETGAVQGYRWGTTRKRALLAWEAGKMSRTKV